ncbi:hypothetical protein [Aeromonas phage 62AhydR11PP]|nr:hypothetical protein [Aeromonas phage 62AhydR11PP]
MNWDNDRALLILLQSGLAGCIYCVMILALITQESEMKISNSKKELARIVSENGGWRDGAEWAWFQGKLKGGPCHEVWFGEAGSEPEYVVASGSFHCYWSMVVDKFSAKKFDNWHQTILSRAEYFHLYPAPDADGWIEWGGGECPVKMGTLIDVKYRDGHLQLGCRSESRCDTELYATTHSGNSGGISDIIAYRPHKPERSKPEFCESVVRSIPEPDEQVWTNPPSIEQLAADYRNAKDYAERKQQEADDAKADADEKLRVLEIAGEALGLLVSPITAKQDAELVITDLRDLRVGDVVELISFQGGSAKVGEIGKISKFFGNGDFHVDFPSQSGYSVDHSHIKFIRRP